MGLGKSKQPKPAQPGMPSQPGFSAQTQVQPQASYATQPTYATQAYPSQGGYLVQPTTYQAQPMQQSIYQTGYSTAHAYPTVAQTQPTTAYPGSVYSSQTSSYPVSYTNQR